MKNRSIWPQILLAIVLLLGIYTTATSQMGPTIATTGVWQGISSHQVIQAKIDDQLERICLPRLEFNDEIDQQMLKKTVQEGIPTQNAIFQLYHDGLGRPKKENGMYYASDVFLKDLKMTYTAYLRKAGYKFKVSKTPAYEDKELLRGVLYSDHITTRMAEQDKQEADKDKKPATMANLSTMRVTTIYDVLPKGVIPPRIRKQQEEIARRIAELKNRPYETEIVQIDPLRWASGRMGLIREDGVISGANVEGQKPELVILPPEQPGWLTPKMIGELNGQPCEFVLHRYANGLEVIQDSRYLVRDIYFSNWKITWEEWLDKNGIKYSEPDLLPDFASGTIALEVKLVSGTFDSLRAPVLCQVNFATPNRLVGKNESFRVFPPDPRPNNFTQFANSFNDMFKSSEADVSILVCPDGQPYTEIGQRRARRIYFPEYKATLDMLQNRVLTGKPR
ncbi:MAG TPA: hypothetical protein DCG57_18065 [Candidatus Riflebacteria bacterium]|jgi:hypothetical protein|nr:hypothetical protein [Candidatus Riflebacteria bacterium]